LLTYAALDGAGGTAPGQLTVSEMRDVYRVDRLGPTTCVFGFLGPDTETERLREYNAWFSRDAVDAVAVPFVASIDAATTVTAFRELPVSGWHVHGAELQRDVVAALDEIRASTPKVNAIVRGRDGGLVGHWVESPREQYDLWRSSLPR
jgi:3-dehydroquinate dehydratase/shikimate dehydrogenase